MKKSQKKDRLKPSQLNQEIISDYFLLAQHPDEGQPHVIPSDSEEKADRRYRQQHPYRPGERPREIKKREIKKEVKSEKRKEADNEQEHSLTFDPDFNAAINHHERQLRIIDHHEGGLSDFDRLKTSLTTLKARLKAHEKYFLLILSREFFNRPYPQKCRMILHQIQKTLQVLDQFLDSSSSGRKRKLIQLREQIETLSDNLQVAYPHQDFLGANRSTWKILRTMRQTFLDDVKFSRSAPLLYPSADHAADSDHSLSMEPIDLGYPPQGDPNRIKGGTPRSALEIRRLKEELSSLRENTDDDRHTIQILRMEASRKDTVIHQTQQSLTEQEASCHRLKKRASHFKGQRDHYKALSDKQSVKLEKVTQALQESSKREETFSKELKAARAREQELTVKLDASLKREDGYKAELKISREQRIQLKDELTISHHQTSRFQEALERSQARESQLLDKLKLSIVSNEPQKKEKTPLASSTHTLLADQSTSRHQRSPIELQGGSATNKESEARSDSPSMMDRR